MFVLTKLTTVFISILTVHIITQNHCLSVYDKLNQDMTNLGHMVRKTLGMSRKCQRTKEMSKDLV